jgi:hypothetical protein
VPQQVLEYDGFTLHKEPLRSPVSFLDFDGVVLFAGAYETVNNSGWEPSVACVALADLDRREREFFTALEQGKVIVFLIPYLSKCIGPHRVDSRLDLFRRVAESVGLIWDSMEKPFAAVESHIPEFKGYVSKFGTSYVTLLIESTRKEMFATICAGPRNCYGRVLLGKVFFLPCTQPQNHQQALQSAAAAVESVIAYRKRISKEMPEWTAEFVFSNESSLRTQAADFHKQIVQIEDQIDRYTSFKGVLCYQSDPLVEVVRNLLDHFFGISLTIDDKCIEDATIRDAQGAILAVVEVKGVKSNFVRNNVNQVDSHRERLGLESAVAGILIMNTLMGVKSLPEKDQPPHPDIIKKAVADHVLLVRTLDLLRYADAIERGHLTKEVFHKTILTESGWLKVEGETATVERG